MATKAYWRISLYGNQNLNMIITTWQPKITQNFHSMATETYINITTWQPIFTQKYHCLATKLRLKIAKLTRLENVAVNLLKRLSSDFLSISSPY